MVDPDADQPLSSKPYEEPVSLCARQAAATNPSQSHRLIFAWPDNPFFYDVEADLGLRL